MPRNETIAQFVRARLLLSIAVTTAASATAFAQDANESPAPQEVVVTGSRIPAPNLESTSPIQVVTSEEIALGGRMDISDVINQLPQNFNNSLGQDLGNRTSGLTTAGGVATADLRGLGPNRTLVLVNGRRLGIGSPYTAIQQPAPDLDQIPTMLLERVDVVTGGASAVYGSDAIAGVVNFILKKNFEGFQVDYQIGQNWYENDSKYVQQKVIESGDTPLNGSSKDGKNQNIHVMAGTNFADGRGNVTAYFGYLTSDPVRSADRDFGGCQLVANATLTDADCLGSSNSNQFRLSGTTVDYSVVGNDFVPFATQTSTPPPFFNSQPYIYMARQDRRYNAGFLGHVDVNDFVKPYFEFGFMNDKSHQEIAPSALFKDSNPTDAISNNYNVNCSNPFLSAQQQSVIGCSAADIAADQADPGSVTRNLRIGRRNIEGGGRSSDYEHTNYRAVAGFKGDLGNAWSYDAYGQYYYVTFFNSNNKYLSFNNINNALLVTGTRANPQCVSGGACVPYNIFESGGVTPEAVSYLSLAGTGSGNTTLRTLHGDITGDLGTYNIRSPLATDGLAVNVGAEHRSEELVFSPDAAEQSGDLSGFGGAAVAIDKGYSVNEEFIEMRVPIAQGKPGIKDLLFDAGYRHSDYSTAGKLGTHKFELQYAPIEDLRFRASFQRAIRAPGLIELFKPGNVGQIAIGLDPCAPTQGAGGALIHAAASLAQCANSGVTAAQYGDGFGIPQGTANQLSQLQGGNPNLSAETSNSYTIGLTFTPTFLPNFTGSLDYYNIKLNGAITSFPANVIITNCLATGDPQFCSQIVRQPATGALTGASVASGGYILQTAVNIAQAQVAGIDVQANYRWQFSEKWGSLSFALNGAYLDKSTATQGPGVATYDCAGLFGAVCQTVNPRWHHLFRTSWHTPWNVMLSANWRYYGSVSLDQNSDNPTLHFATFGAFNEFNSKIGSYSYLDLAGTWQIKDGLQFRAGINNALDKAPPIITSEITSGGAANTYETYDSLGRQWFAAFTAKF
jgi:outer membrane receptor protein involved in Fe transport